MYSFNSRIRYSETDDKGQLTIPGLINYFQDCSTFHSEEVGQGLMTLKEKNRAWIIIYWQIEIVRLPKLAEEITVSTMATGAKGLCAKRNFYMSDKEGNILARADSIWVLMDTKRMRPTKIMPEDIQAYTKEDPLPMEEKKRKVDLPEIMEEYPEILISKEHIDTNGHVNNCRYIQMVFQLLKKEIKTTGLRVEYVKSAVEGDTIYPKIAVEEKRIVAGLFDTKDRPYAIVEIVC